MEGKDRWDKEGIYLPSLLTYISHPPICLSSLSLLSVTSALVKGCGPDVVIISYWIIYYTLSSRYDLTVYSVADVCQCVRWCTAQSNEGDWGVPARLRSALACVLNLYCLIYNYKIILNYLWYFVIICKEHTLQVTGRAVTYRYSTTESLYLFMPSVRVPGYIRLMALT